jgi:hypothetical protein
MNILFLQDFFKSPPNDINEIKLYLLIASGFFIISALGIIFNPVIHGVEKKINENLLPIKSKMNDLYSKISELSNDVINHNEYIKKYVSEKEILSSLEQIVENGLSYIDENKSIYVYLNEISRIYIEIISELLDIGIDNFSQRSLKNKIFILNKAMFQDKIKWVDKQYLEHLKRIRYEKSNKNLDFIKDLLIIKNDKFNSKEDRFRISAESFLHNLLRDIILTYNDYKYKNNE